MNRPPPGMPGVRIRSTTLAYGCHTTTVEFPADGSPVLIVGPNGSGKTTLVEGIVRTLYGFNRQRRDDRLQFDRRRPWEDEPFCGVVCLERPDGGRLVIERDFATDRVTVKTETGAGPSSSEVLFEGTANAAAGGRTAHAYARLLTEHIGFDCFEDYRRTAFIQQGQLTDTALGDHLLQLAAGGHAALDAARQQLRDGYRELTREPLAEGDRRLAKDRQLESIRAEIEELTGVLERARAEERQRQPLYDKEREHATAAESLDREIRLLEDALEPLAGFERACDRCAALEERLGRLERFARLLDESRSRSRRAEAEWQECAAGPDDPDDLVERLAVLGELWTQRADIEARMEERNAGAGTGRLLIASPRVALTAAVLTIVAGALAVAAHGLPRVVLLGLAGVAATAAFASLYSGRRARERDRSAAAALAVQRADVTRRIGEQSAGIPDGASLDPQAAALRRQAFERRRRARLERDRATEAMRALLQDIEAELPSQRELALGNGTRDEGGDGWIAPTLAREVSRTRTELATRTLERERSTATSLPLPDGVEPRLQAVRHALDSRRQRLRDHVRALADVRRRLHEVATGDNPFTIENRLAALLAREAELEREAEAIRAAWELLGDAYTEFRGTDQDRLLEHISDQLRRVGGGEFGPLTTESVLEATVVQAGGRRLPLESPPLSFGELHAVLLAVRLGAADFLAGTGNRAPLIIDEPFAHLDETRARLAWAQLREVARGRQTIITTQARAVVEALGVGIDLELERAATDTSATDEARPRR